MRQTADASTRGQAMAKVLSPETQSEARRSQHNFIGTILTLEPSMEAQTCQNGNKDQIHQRPSPQLQDLGTSLNLTFWLVSLLTIIKASTSQVLFIHVATRAASVVQRLAEPWAAVRAHLWRASRANSWVLPSWWAHVSRSTMEHFYAQTEITQNMITCIELFTEYTECS